MNIYVTVISNPSVRGTLKKDLYAVFLGRQGKLRQKCGGVT
jgi:hypothetical protein